MSATSQYWVHDLSPYLIQFPENRLGIDGIPYYGLSYMIAFLCAWLLLRTYNAKGQFQINADARATLMSAMMIGVLAGGRLGYMVLYDLEDFLSNPLLVFRVDQGGMASHGGFVGVILALCWFAHRQKYSLLRLGDVVATLAPLGLMLGRIANFINGELWGRVTTVPWAVIFPGSPANYDVQSASYILEPRHPSQLYQAGLEGALLFAYVQWRFWKTRPANGQIAGEFLIGYSLLRIIAEFFREPDSSLIMGISRGQFYSIFLIIAGAVLVAYAQKNQRKQNTGT